MDIIDLLSSDKYNQLQLEYNYNILKEKWGEWILFGEGNLGINVKYINISKALFSGLMIIFTILTFIFILSIIIINKIILPILIKMYTDNNNELVDIATLKTLEQVNEISGKKEKNKKPKKEWF